MNDERPTSHLFLRTFGALSIVAGLGMALLLPVAWGQTGALSVFTLVACICAGVALGTRGIGDVLGAIAGSSVGLLTAVVVSVQFGAPPTNLLAFLAVATVVLGFLGYLAGGSIETHPERAPTPRPAPVAVELPDPRRTPDEVDVVREEERITDTWLATSVEEIFAALSADFSHWVETQAGQRCLTDAPDWAAFDHFVRTSLREQLGASGVRVYEVSSDGETLRPLTRSAGASGETPSAREGLMGHVVTSGRLYVAGQTDEAPLIRSLIDADARMAQEGSEVHGGAVGWAWLLPLRAARRTCALVAVRRVDKAGCRSRAVAEAVRNQLQLFWGHVCVLRALWQHMRTDRQSGMLNRTELLTGLNEAVRGAARDGEPVMVLAMAVEGLRRLDDTGRWSQRDVLVQRLGQVLGQKVRSDDLMGRFSDDRFIIVLRRLDSALGTLVAEKLLETVRANVLDVHDQAGGVIGAPAGHVHLKLRAGLAGTGLLPAGRPFPTFASDASAGSAGADLTLDGRLLLERALGLLDYAREQRIDIATDLMSGLPDALTRSRGAQSAEPLTNSDAPATPAAPESPGASAEVPAPSTAEGQS